MRIFFICVLLCCFPRKTAALTLGTYWLLRLAGSPPGEAAVLPGSPRPKPWALPLRDFHSPAWQPETCDTRLVRISSPRRVLRSWGKSMASGTLLPFPPTPTRHPVRSPLTLSRPHSLLVSGNFLPRGSQRLLRWVPRLDSLLPGPCHQGSDGRR